VHILWDWNPQHKGTVGFRAMVRSLCGIMNRVWTLGVKWSQPCDGQLNPAVPTKNPYLIQAVRGGWVALLFLFLVDW